MSLFNAYKYMGDHKTKALKNLSKEEVRRSLPIRMFFKTSGNSQALPYDCIIIKTKVGMTKEGYAENGDPLFYISNEMYHTK